MSATLFLHFFVYFFLIGSSILISITYSYSAHLSTASVGSLPSSRTLVMFLLSLSTINSILYLPACRFDQNCLLRIKWPPGEVSIHNGNLWLLIPQHEPVSSTMTVPVFQLLLRDFSYTEDFGDAFHHIFYKPYHPASSDQNWGCFQHQIPLWGDFHSQWELLNLRSAVLEYSLISSIPWILDLSFYL